MKEFLLYLFGLPGMFVILFLFIGFYIFTSRLNKARTVSMVLLVTVLLFTNVHVGQILASYLIEGVKFKKVRSLTDIDMIVMPTQGIDYNGEITGWTPNQESFKAANIAYFLQAKLADRKVPVLMCGGQTEGNNSSVNESEIIYNYFAGQTSQVRRTLTETISKNLYEQVWQCANIMERYNVKNPALVTSELKMLRTLALFRSRGVEATPFPVFVLNEDRSSGISRYLPSIDGLLLNRAVLTEYVELGLDLINERIKLVNLAYKDSK